MQTEFSLLYPKWLNLPLCKAKKGSAILILVLLLSAPMLAQNILITTNDLNSSLCLYSSHKQLSHSMVAPKSHANYADVNTNVLNSTGNTTSVSVYLLTDEREKTRSRSKLSGGASAAILMSSGSQYASTGEATTTASQGRPGQPHRTNGYPDIPFPDVPIPMGEVPFVLMLLLGIGYAYRQRQRKRVLNK